MVGYKMVGPEKSCSNHAGVEDILTEDQCIDSETYVTSSLNPNGRYVGTVVNENEPKGCYLNGIDIYWNTPIKGLANTKSRSICKSKDSGECAYISIFKCT